MLTEKEKAERARQRLIEKAKEVQLGTYCSKFVAPIFQQMIRAEAAAQPANRTLAILYGLKAFVWREVGQCVCVTCGKVGPWKSQSVYGGIMDTGHFLAGRTASIIFEETNAHPQCKHCNKYLSGNQANYELFMRHRYGQDEIDRLRRLKNAVRKFTREELVDLRIDYAARLKGAVMSMEVRQ